MKKVITIIMAVLMLCPLLTYGNKADRASAWNNIIFRVSVNNSGSTSNVTGGKFRITNNRTGAYEDFDLIPNTVNSSVYYEGIVPDSSLLQEGDTVTVTEISPPPGYISDYYTSLTARVNSNGVLIITDHPVRGEEQTRFRFNNWYYYAIYSRDVDGKPLPGAVFNVSVPDEGVSKDYISENGVIEYTIFRDGEDPVIFYVTEETPPYGYKLSISERTKTFDFHRPGAGTDVSYLNPAYGVWENEPHMIKIIREDENGNGLAGAQFRITGTGEDGVSKDETTTTNSSGEAEQSLAGWRNGTYTITEVVPPKGYALNTQPLVFELNGNELVHGALEFGSISLEVEVINVSAKDIGDLRMLLPGGVFEITGPRQHKETAKDGRFTQPLGGWESGVYTVRQVTPPSGYMLDPDAQEFTLNGDGTVTPERLVFRNAPLELTILNVCGESREPLDGAQFRITRKESGQGSVYGGDDEAGIATASEFNAIILTAKDGVIKQSLAGWGAGTYIVTEMVAPKGYALGTKPQEFTIVGDGTITPEVLTFVSEPLKIHAEKVDAEALQVLTNNAEDDWYDEWPDVPQTGGENILNWIIPLMVIASIGAAVLHMRMARKRRGDG